MAEDTLHIRLRHTYAGDLGPYTLPDSTTVQQLKDKIISEWPKDGAWAKEPPSQSGDVRLILSGKFLDNSKALKDYRKEMGELKPDTTVTMHLHVRPQQTPSQKPSAAPDKQQEQQGCGCIVS